MSRETPNLTLWQTLASRAASGNISNDELAKRFERDIVPFWKEASTRLKTEERLAGTNTNPFLPPIADFASARLKLAQSVIATVRDRS